jgi:hypothetical protein
MMCAKTNMSQVKIYDVLLQVATTPKLKRKSLNPEEANA